MQPNLNTEKMAAKSSTKVNQEHERCSSLAFVSIAALHNASSLLFYRFANFLKMVKEETLSVVLGKDGEGGVPWVDFLSNATTEKNDDFSKIHNEDTFESHIDSRILETVVKRAFRGHSSCSFYR